MLISCPHCHKDVETSQAASGAQSDAVTDKKRLMDWMRYRSFATGHADSMDALLRELDWQIKELCEKIAPATASLNEEQVEKIGNSCPATCCSLRVMNPKELKRYTGKVNALLRSQPGKGNK